MKRVLLATLVASLGAMVLISPVWGQMATTDEGMTVAQNWIALITQKKGNWGGYANAQVDAIQEFKRGERTIGYFCWVQPTGYIVISLRKELAPVKVYSDSCNLDPESDEGMTDLIKACMERTLNAVEQQIGPIDSVQTQDLEKMLEIDYRQSWTELERDAEAFKEQLNSGGIMNYYEGEVLLTSSWHQHDPYNRQCPVASGTCTDPRCAVGCVATAGAQIMRYWNWPPSGVGSPYSDAYDWPNMRDTVTGSSPTAEINAVAELCREIGIAVNMNYCESGCASGSQTYDMEGVYENHYRYSTACVRRNRPDYTAVDWFNRLKAQFNVNRPVHYRILGHSIVGDGWQETGSNPILREYHMNYGWNDSHNAWYTLDALHQPGGGNINDEYILENIYPAPSLGSSISGVYTPPSFPYRYFDRDATASNAIFRTNQHLQFLHNVKVSVSSTPGSSLRFEGSSPAGIRLFSRGDVGRGIAIDNAVINVFENGSIKFH